MPFRWYFVTVQVVLAATGNQALPNAVPVAEKCHGSYNVEFLGEEPR